jgi:CheY-like chemotaxis protein
MIKSLRILLVEDNPLNQKIVRFYILRDKHELRIASSGEEALELFSNDIFDVVLMDLMLPGIDGFETTVRMRKIENENMNKQATKVIALTANTLDNDRERCRKYGMDEFLAKPFDINKFYFVLNNLNTGGN